MTKGRDFLNGNRVLFFILPAGRLNGDTVLIQHPVGKGQLIAVPDDLLPLDNTDKHIPVIHNRDKILIHCRHHQIFDGGADPHSRCTGAAVNFTKRLFFRLPQILKIMILNIPEQIAFGNDADIFPFAGNNRDCRILMVFHLLQRLPQRKIIIQIGDFAFGRQKMQNIHK